MSAGLALCLAPAALASFWCGTVVKWPTGVALVCPRDGKSLVDSGRLVGVVILGHPPGRSAVPPHARSWQRECAFVPLHPVRRFAPGFVQEVWFGDDDIPG